MSGHAPTTHTQKMQETCKAAFIVVFMISTSNTISAGGCLHKFISTLTFSHTHTFIHTYTHTCSLSHQHTNSLYSPPPTHTHTHTYIHTHSHTHSYTHSPLQKHTRTNMRAFGTRSRFGSMRNAACMATGQPLSKRTPVERAAAAAVAQYPEPSVASTEEEEEELHTGTLYQNGSLRAHACRT